MFLQTRIAAIRWSKKSTEVLPLNAYEDKERFFNLLDNVPFRGGGGQLHKALNMLADSTLSVELSRGTGKVMPRNDQRLIDRTFILRQFC